LRENGNHYGPSFQNVSAIWLADSECLGRLKVVSPHERIEHHVIHPTLLDSLTQLMAPFIMERGKPFVLRAIEKVEIRDVNFPETLWGQATLLAEIDADGKRIVGNVRAFDESGKTYLECTGVELTLLDSFDAGDQNRALTLAIASNFTAEPLEDPLKFWGDYFGSPVHLEFAPYNQLFQQLLDPGSAFRKNRDGINIILLGLEEWLAAEQLPVITLDRAKADECFHNLARYVLPNGLEIVHLNKYETEYLYREIFVDKSYLKHGMRLHDGDTVLDVGANIGLFSLFVMNHVRNPRIYAFEPAPVAYEILKANCAAYGSNAHAVNAGVSDKAKTAMLTFYEKSSVFSGFHAHEAEDSKAIRAIVRSILETETSVASEDLESYVDQFVADRLTRQNYECQMTSISDIVRENHLDKINLLKIDAEKSELEIIRGIEEQDWPKIAQIVIEIHDPTCTAVAEMEDVLTRKGFQCFVDQESLLKHAGLFNLYATRPEVEHQTHPISSLQRNVQDLCVAMRSFMNKATAPLVLCLCPPAPATAANAKLRAMLRDLEQTLMSEAAKIPNVHAISSKFALQLYPVADYYDPHSRLLGNIPYTSDCYAAFGTALSRTIFNLKRTPFKVIVLDCDNTLWNGVCGEVGPMGVEVDPPHRALQEFVVGQMNAGKLLCLCSKNNESDVMAVFDKRDDMVLKRKHLTSWRINWKSKSENVQSLANELNLNLDSFIFIDDNPVDCADVRINTPGVLTLQTPQNSSSIPSFLKHVWTFDDIGSTEEDRNRTRMYQENAQRQQFLDQTLSLKDFINGLQIRVEIAEVSDDQFSRVSQLTFRTNQFNLTTIRRHENEIRNLLRREDLKCLGVRVIDRFGDYGLVGVVVYEIKADRYKLDTFLLSCRVLGRGVEHTVLAHLGQRAIQESKKFVELTCLPTEMNLPAREFIKYIGDKFGNSTGTSWIFPAEYLASLEYDCDETAQNRNQTSTRSTTNTLVRSNRIKLSERLQRIAENLCDIGLISKAIEDFRLREQPLSTDGDFTGATALQTAVMTIWRKVLGRSRIAMNDNFFEAGGTSLKAVQVIAMIKKELQQNLSIVTLFEYPTVTLLAAKLSADSEGAITATNITRAVHRGQNRRMKLMRQKAD
jgi:FkbH-like protein/FkbM family methyltransferase